MPAARSISPDAPGLSTAHICTHTTYRGGSLTLLKPPKGSVRPGGGGRRGKVSEFSRASRRRLQRLLASIDRGQTCTPLFVTLTYPDRFPRDERTWKKHLRAFRERLVRKFGKSAAVWRLEFKVRKTGEENAGEVAPHFHLLLFLDKPPSELYGWLSRSWYEVVGSDDMSHLASGTSVSRVKSWRGMMSYASKYMGKLEQLQSAAQVGRLWGVWYRELLPISAEETPITLDSFFKLRRVLRRYAKIRSTHRMAGLGCFVSYGTANRLLAAYGYYRS